MNEKEEVALKLLPALESLDRLVEMYGEEVVSSWTDAGISVERLRFALQGILIKSLVEASK